MDDVGKESGNAGWNGLIDRVKAIVMKPKETWPTIAGETATPSDLMMKYAVPLAAIGPVASFLHGQLFGYGFLGFSYRPGLVGGLSSAIVGYVLNLVGIVVLAFIADWLAPKFDGTSDRISAFKLVVYGSTAAWVAGIFSLIPGLGMLGLLGLYSLYLYYTGATPLMKVPEAKAAGYTAVTILAAVLLYLVVGSVTAGVTGLFGGGLASNIASADDGEVTGKLSIPGVGTIDAGKVAEASKQIGAAAHGQRSPLAPGAIQALLPANIGGYQRTALESTAMGNMGSQAEGTYTSGDRSFTLKIADMNALGAIAGIGAAMGIEENREDANGYERTGTVDGHMQSEKWNRADSRGSFGTMVGNRFLIEAEGTASSIDELKSAVAAVDQSQLAALAK